MAKFEFTITIISIVIAFALTELMAGWGRIIRHSPRPRIDWIFAGWSAGILLTAILHWAGLWLYAEHEFESLHDLFALSAPPLLLVAIAFLLAPSPSAGAVLDLRTYFRDVSRPMLLLLAAFVLLSVVADVVVGNASVLDPFELGALGYALALVSAAIFNKEGLQIAVLAVLWAAMLLPALGLVESPGW